MIDIDYINDAHIYIYIERDRERETVLIISYIHGLDISLLHRFRYIDFKKYMHSYIRTYIHAYIHIHRHTHYIHTYAV